jgi:glucose-1-phosphate thymidylyltransferase
MSYLGSGVDRDLKFSYKVQENSGGIAEALSLAKDFIGDDKKFAVILGDNVFEGNFRNEFDDFEMKYTGAMIFVKEVEHPERFGVVAYSAETNEPIFIVEKPMKSFSKHAVTGLYLYDQNVFDIIKTLEPSERGELEITDVNNWYMKKKWCTLQKVEKFWSDAGTPESLLATANWAKEYEEKNRDASN